MNRKLQLHESYKSFRKLKLTFNRNWNSRTANFREITSRS